MDALALGRIHPSALIDKGARVGSNVTIGAYAVVHDGVNIGDESIIGSHCVLGEPDQDFYADTAHENPPLEIGDRALIRSHSCLYAGSEIGEGFSTGHRVTIREGSRIGSHVRVGTLGDIQGNCTVGDYVSLHSNVHVGQKSVIGNYVWIFPYTVLTNDPQPPSDQLIGVTVEDYAVIATMVVVLPGVSIGKNSLVGASALVKSNVAPEAVVVGNPARQVATIRELKRSVDGRAGYPWREHYDKGMPWQDIGYAKWSKERAEEVGA